jgi:phage FluMu protein Com
MAIKPEPKLLKCSQCRWNKLFAPKSDVLTGSDLPDKCPKCGAAIEFADLPAPLKWLGQLFK